MDPPFKGWLFCWLQAGFQYATGVCLSEEEGSVERKETEEKQFPALEGKIFMTYSFNPRDEMQGIHLEVIDNYRRKERKCFSNN